nr:EOG090X05Q1 [Sida crystallina]
MVDKKTAHQKEDVQSTDDDVFEELQEDEPRGSLEKRDTPSMMEPLDSFMNQFDNSSEASGRGRSQLAMNATINSQRQRMDMKLYHDLEQLNSMRSSASKDRLMQRLLQKVTQPKLWKSATTGETIQVDTAEIEQLRDTRRVYEAICNATLTEERVRALHLLKRMVRSSQLTKNHRLTFACNEVFAVFSSGIYAALPLVTGQLSTESGTTVKEILQAFLEHKQTDTLIRMVNDRLNYGLFPDYYLSNILMDTFLKEENFRDAVKVATQMMLQEEFEHPIANCMALYSCYAYLKRPQPEVWDPQPQPKPEEPTEVVKVRVDYLREPYFDDHFDLTEPRHLIGKSLVGFGKCFEESVRHTSTLLGWTMFGKHDKVIQHLDDILGSPSNAKPLIYKEWASHSQKLVQEASEPLPEGFVDQFNTRLQRLENEGFLCDGDILERIRQLTTEAVQKHQKSDIDVQLKTYAEWEERRQFEVDAQIKEIDRRQRLAVLEAKKRELQEKEELLHFFDNLDEWELRYQEKEEEIAQCVCHREDFGGPEKHPKEHHHQVRLPFKVDNVFIGNYELKLITI